MGYYYTNPEREDDPHALPNVEVWLAPIHECQACGAQYPGNGKPESAGEGCPECDSGQAGPIGRPARGWFYAYGFPGCLHDSDPIGAFETEEEAFEAARESIE